MRVALLLLAAAAAAEQTHVVVAGSGSHALGVVACARSIFLRAAGPVRVHVVVHAQDTNDFKEALQCALPSQDWRVVEWEGSGVSQRVSRLVSVRHGKKGYLAHSLNYARFYSREVLRDVSIKKVLWLDSDTVVVGDITRMIRNALATGTHAISAVPRAKRVCGTHFLNCSDPDALELLWETRVDVDALDAFNAGVVVYHLERWREQKLTEKVERWLELNLRRPAFTLGTNPPLVLATGGRFEPLDQTYNCQVGGGHGCAQGLANGSTPSGVLHWSGERKPWWAAGLSSAAGVRSAWSHALGADGARCALRALSPDAAPNATVVIPVNVQVPDFFAFRKGGPVFDGSNVSALMEEHTEALRSSTISGSKAAASALRHRLSGRDPCGVLIVILRGRLYVSLPKCARQLTVAEQGALQTLHRAVAGFDSVPPPLVLQFAAPDTTHLAIEAVDRFAYHSAPAVACDAFECAAKLARNALFALAEAIGPLQERDILTVCADCSLRPVRFDDALRRAPQRLAGARKGLKGYFAARAPVQISHREENVLDLRVPEQRAQRRRRRRAPLPPPVG